MTDTFSPPTWRMLGLGVAFSYTGLGLLAMGSTAFPARVFGIQPAALTSEDPTARCFPLLGIRDLSIATALFAFNAKNWPEAMGILISSSMLLCAWDVYEVMRNNGLVEGAAIGAGAAIWGLIGYGLLGLKSFD